MFLAHDTAIKPPQWAPAQIDWRREGTLVACSGTPEPGWWAFVPKDGWHDAGDGWRIHLSEGELPAERKTRIDDHDGCVYCTISSGEEVQVVPITDLFGRRRLIPLIMSEDGHILMRMPLVMGDDGLPQRKPTPGQQRLISAATYLREQVESYDGTLRMDLDCVAELLAACCCCSPAGLINSGTIDEHMIIRATAAIGCMNVLEVVHGQE